MGVLWGKLPNPSSAQFSHPVNESALLDDIKVFSIL